jgi:hypothetical protein
MSVCIVEAGNAADGPAPPEPFGRMGIADNFFVARRRRCAPASTSSSRLDLATQAVRATQYNIRTGSQFLPLLPENQNLSNEMPKPGAGASQSEF